VPGWRVVLREGASIEFACVGVSIAVPLAYEAGKWQHLACTLDQASRTGRVYLDGALREAGSTTSYVADENTPLKIGSYETPETKFHGTLDDVRIYDRALSETEIAALALGQETN